MISLHPRTHNEMVWLVLFAGIMIIALTHGKVTRS